MNVKFKFLSIFAFAAVSQTASFSYRHPRRAFLSNIQTVVATPVAIATASVLSPGIAKADGKDALVDNLKISREKMVPIPSLLEQSEWNKVRTILKTPPVNSLWNLGDSQNTLVQLSKITGDFEFLELKDELALSLQMCDQITYGNSFVGFQPGNGKVDIKGPTTLSYKAISQIDDALKLAE